MFERLPPTQTLRAFEAAARLGNYTRAGEELHLTHSAISHQIRALEQRIGRKLFQREGRQMMLTDGGRLLAEEVRQALLALDRALQIGKVERQQATQTLRVSVSPSFASAWLVPRLAAFHQQHPHIDISLRSTHELSELDFSDADVAIWYGRAGHKNFRYRHLLKEVVFPVCSPAFGASHPTITPRDLPHYPLLRFAHHGGWEPWFSAAGIQHGEPQTGPVYDDPMHLLDAAAADQGIALARSCLAHNHLASGRLIRLFNITAPARGTYFSVSPFDTGKEAAITEFQDWLGAILSDVTIEE
ncbi:LysR family transcriptional regulator, glycine cleavage system transcriptional activator [Collimonas sp. OK607]|uniref:transcriptional regulator GcvA n=1 Tax=Collimonas sp. OK607 TaxID=1798194 RepID=UPI0008E5AAFF|nr:transcriptional regulator GcvA [Collimonas sp. OK607]SFB32078.1 LysR family transcriptional regulator, glycine cleavage system transcriptional activator [Collimonas sp. OK607]